MVCSDSESGGPECATAAAHSDTASDSDSESDSDRDRPRPESRVTGTVRLRLGCRPSRREAEVGSTLADVVAAWLARVCSAQAFCPTPRLGVIHSDPSSWLFISPVDIRRQTASTCT
eukprot:2085216-Rhodomonas_salina.1